MGILGRLFGKDKKEETRTTSMAPVAPGASTSSAPRPPAAGNDTLNKLTQISQQRE